MALLKPFGLQNERDTVEKLAAAGWSTAQMLHIVDEPTLLEAPRRHSPILRWLRMRSRLSSAPQNCRKSTPCTTYSCPLRLPRSAT